jgi:dihydrodipicolinate synthase/N-acetylneuraminate lyase
MSIFIFAALQLTLASDSNAQKASIYQKHVITPAEFKERLKGPILSIPTAFTESFEIDYKGMSKVIRRAIHYECKVVALTSGNSKYDRLSYDEVKKLTKFLIQTVNNKGMTLAATGNWSLDTIINYVRYAESIGASGVQVDVPKEIAKDSSIKSTLRFYRLIAENTHLAIVLHGYYSESLLKELVKIKSIVALKEDAADLSYYAYRQIIFGNRLAIFAGGSDARYLYGFPYGSPAYFSTLYTYAPEIGLKFWKAIQIKDLKTAVKIVSKYDIPFMKHFTFPFWAAAIEYMGGSQRYIRPRPGDKLKQETLMGDELIKMQEIFCEIGLKPSGCDYCFDITEGTSIPQQWRRAGHIAGKVAGKVVVAGGNNWSIDKTTKNWLRNTVVFVDGKWIAGPDLPKSLSFAAFAFDKNGLYVAGGTNGSKSLSDEVYKLTALKEGEGWTSLPNLPIAVSHASGADLQGNFYVACGSVGEKNTNRMWVLDMNTPGSSWKECKSVPGPGRELSSLVACGKYLYLLGGLADTSPLTPLKDAYRYDPQIDQWVQLADLPLDGYAWVSASIDNNHIMITGRAFGSIDKGIWILALKDMSMTKAGININPVTTAPLVKIAEKQWWLIGGEPDANKNRTGKVSVITIK